MRLHKLMNVAKTKIKDFKGSFNMKKFMLCVAFFLAFCVGTAYFMEVSDSPKVSISTGEVKKENAPQEPQVTPNHCAINNEGDYELKEYEGTIAIFKTGKKAPVKTTSIAVNDLPKTDREMLKTGIKASSEEELNVLLEDYCS